MNILFPLRSLGDFVIDAYIIKEKPGEVKFDTVLIPAYLKQLSVLIDATQVEPIEIDFIFRRRIVEIGYCHKCLGLKWLPRKKTVKMFIMIDC